MGSDEATWEHNLGICFYYRYSPGEYLRGEHHTVPRAVFYTIAADCVERGPTIQR